MKTNTLLTCFFLTNLFLAGCTQKETGDADAANPPAPEMTQEALVKRGEYMVKILGCNDCHSPKIMTAQGPAPDPSRLLAGHPMDEPLPAITDPKMVAPGAWALFNGGLTAAVGPWGTTYAANLTPDETGLGNWTIENFKKALKEGKAKGLDGGRMLLPPMPWQNYTDMADEDVEAVWAYLRSIQPVRNVVPAPVPPAAG